ncbi:MAG: hypothetical protein WBO71_00245, partial [Thermoanaerobaculia bacterium]
PQGEAEVARASIVLFDVFEVRNLARRGQPRSQLAISEVSPKRAGLGKLSLESWCREGFVDGAYTRLGTGDA